MQPITYYVQTPAIDVLVQEYGDYLQRMSRADRLSFLRLLVQTVEDPPMDEPDGPDNAQRAYWIVANTEEDALLSLIAAIATELAWGKP